MGYKINERSDNIIIVSKEKYRSRLDKMEAKKVFTPINFNYCLNQPIQAIEFLNLSIKRCPKCISDKYIKINTRHL